MKDVLCFFWYPVIIIVGQVIDWMSLESLTGIYGLWARQSCKKNGMGLPGGSMPNVPAVLAAACVAAWRPCPFRRQETEASLRDTISNWWSWMLLISWYKFHSEQFLGKIFIPKSTFVEMGFPLNHLRGLFGVWSKHQSGSHYFTTWADWMVVGTINRGMICSSGWSRWWATQIFFGIFTPNLGEDETILTSYFSNGLVQPPTSVISGMTWTPMT